MYNVKIPRGPLGTWPTGDWKEDLKHAVESGSNVVDFVLGDDGKVKEIPETGSSSASWNSGVSSALVIFGVGAAVLWYMTK